MEGMKDIRSRRKPAVQGRVMDMVYLLFWIYILCGVAGFVIETIWCWIDFGELTSRTSNLFFPISCIWGLGGVLLSLMTMKNRWETKGYVFIKCTVIGTVFEFLCGCLGEQILEVTFWDYSRMPLHIGKYVNLPFCLVWGMIGVLWVWTIYPAVKRKMENPLSNSRKKIVNLFLVFMIVSQTLTGAALLRMHERHNGQAAESRMELFLDNCFTDQTLQSCFPKMKSTVTGENIYVSSMN